MNFQNKETVFNYVVNVLNYINSDKDLKNVFNLELLDGELYYHSVSVAKIACQLALGLTLTDDEIIEIVLGALLHDIGKLLCPQEILYKPDTLTESEKQSIRKHPQHGIDLIKGIEIPSRAKDIIIHHHERKDGTGYPDGITDIKFSTQIVTVSDIFSALTERRCYHKPLSVDDSMDYLNNLANVNREIVGVLISTVSN